MTESGTYSAKAFAQKMDAFIAFCENGGVDATDYQLIRFFGISPEKLEEYRSRNKLNKNSKIKLDGFSVALKKLEMYREDATIRQAIAEPKLASHCTFKLRQLHWGGWNEKAETARDTTIRVKLGDGDKDLAE